MLCMFVFTVCVAQPHVEIPTRPTRNRQAKDRLSIECSLDFGSVRAQASTRTAGYDGE